MPSRTYTRTSASSTPRDSVANALGAPLTALPGRVPPAGTMSPSLHAMLVRVFTQCLAHRFQPAQRQLPLEVNVRER
jgi:hypothetical protein